MMWLERVYPRDKVFEQAYAKYSGPYIQTTVETSKEVLNEHWKWDSIYARTIHTKKNPIYSTSHNLGRYMVYIMLPEH